MRKINTASDLPGAISDIQIALARLTAGQQGGALLNFGLSKKLLCWLETWFDRYLPIEKTFQYKSLLNYKRGMVIFADLGFNVGSEEGGKHYALVVENDNGLDNRTIVVVPLRSVPVSGDLSTIDEKHEVLLGFKLFSDEIQKVTALLSSCNNDFERQKLTDKLDKYNRGSVAVVNQIRAISKLRIISPKRVGDDLDSFTLDAKLLNAVDDKVKSLYIKQTNDSNK